MRRCLEPDRSWIILVFAVLSLHPSASAQLVIRLQPDTTVAFERYAAKVEAALAERTEGRKPFLELEEHSDDLRRVLAGAPFVRAASGSPLSVPGGLIHDWIGSVFFPKTDVRNVIHLLEDFDAHKTVYPQVVDSKTLRRAGDSVAGYWRLQQKGLVPVSFDVEQEARYSEVAPGKWAGHSYARKITERNSNLFAHGRPYPLGEGHGYLWRLYAYWNLEAKNGGVLAECRTLSLSRDVPASLAWAVAPYVEKMPQTSLLSTLEATRRKVAGTP